MAARASSKSATATIANSYWRARGGRDQASVIANELDARRGKYSRNKTARRWGKKRLGDAPATRVRRRSAKFARLQVLEKERERDRIASSRVINPGQNVMAAPPRTSLPRAMYSHDAMPVNSLSAAYFDEIRLKVFRYCPTFVNMLAIRGGIRCRRWWVHRGTWSKKKKPSFVSSSM